MGRQECLLCKEGILRAAGQTIHHWYSSWAGRHLQQTQKEKTLQRSAKTHTASSAWSNCCSKSTSFFMRWFGLRYINK